MEARQDELRRIIEAADDPPPFIHPNLAEIYWRKVEDLHLALEDRATGAEAAEIVRSLVDEIVLTPDGDVLRVDLRGDIATILSLAQNSKNPAAGDRGIEQVKLVAGARYQRYLHLAESWVPRVSWAQGGDTSAV